MLRGGHLQVGDGEPESVWIDRKKLPLLSVEVRIVGDGPSAAVEDPGLVITTVVVV